MSEWQPIETAPKDESWVILSFPRGSASGCEIAFWSEFYGKWYDDEDSNAPLPFLLGCEPTHWMPLPEAPE